MENIGLRVNRYYFVKGAAGALAASLTCNILRGRVRSSFDFVIEIFAQLLIAGTAAYGRRVPFTGLRVIVQSGPAALVGQALDGMASMCRYAGEELSSAIELVHRDMDSETRDPSSTRAYSLAVGVISVFAVNTVHNFMRGRLPLLAGCRSCMREATLDMQIQAAVTATFFLLKYLSRNPLARSTTLTCAKKFLLGSSYLVGKVGVIAGDAVREVAAEIRTMHRVVITTLKSHYVVLGGMIVGFMMGAVANVVRRGSLFASSVMDCELAFRQFPFLFSVNQWREATYGLSMVQIASLALSFSIAAILGQEGRTESGIRGVLQHAWRNLFPAVWPQAMGMFLLIGGVGLRELANTHLDLKRIGIDISGHAIYVFSSAWCAAKLLDSIVPPVNYTLGQRRLIQLTLASLSLTDIPWTYNTIANCHSVADVAAAAFLVASTMLCFRLAKRVFCASYDRVDARLSGWMARVRNPSVMELSVVVALLSVAIGYNRWNRASMPILGS